MGSMEVASGVVKIISELKIATKVANIRWMEDNAHVIYENRKKKKMLEMDFKKEIRVREMEIEKELRTLAEEYEGEFKQTVMKVEQDIKSYERFLSELEKAQSQFILQFESVSPVMALLIHRHASELLNQMWNEEDPSQRRDLEVRLMDVLNSMAEDVVALKKTSEKDCHLPERTIKLMRGS